MSNLFIWADLSTFDVPATKQFYQQCFGWKYEAMDDGYDLCLTNKSPSAGLYEMPETFQNMNMPSFWMSYLHVQNIEQIVQSAEKHGGKIEVEPQPGPGGGTIALIRDPSGAGFTCYQGAPINTKSKGLGCMVWNELNVSSLDKVKSFYETVFCWHIKPTKFVDQYDVFTSADNNNPIAGIRVTSNEIKGEKEYWGVYFSVENLNQAAKAIEHSGGEIISQQPLGEQASVLAIDPQGAAFYIVEKSTQPNVSSSSGKTVKWRAISGLGLILVAILLEQNWIWGVFFLLWLLPDLKHGITHFMERIERHNNPIIYWLIMGVWLSLSIYLLLEPLLGF
jgi:hypothetical protein